MTKCKGGCQMKAGGKTCAKCGCDMDSKKEKYEDEEDDMRKGGSACMKCGGKMHKSGGTISSCMKCGGGKYTFGGKTGWMSKKKVTDKYASGGMIKKDNGSYALGGTVDMPCPPGFVKDPKTGECIQKEMISYNDSLYLHNLGKQYYKDNYGNDAFQKSYGTENITINDPKSDYEKKQDLIYPMTPEDVFITYGNRPEYKKYLDTSRKYNNMAYTALNKGIMPQLFLMGEGAFPYFKKPTLPQVRVPEISVDETRKMMDNFAKERKEKEDYAAYEKWIAENPLAELEPRVNEEMEINPWKIINMPTKSPELIQRNEILPNINTGIKYEKESGEGAYPIMMSNEGQGTVNKKGKRKYQFGGEADNTSMTSDTEIQLGRGAFNVSEPAYDANKIMSRVFNNAMGIKENNQPATKQTGYKEEVEKNKVVKDDKSLPNWGRAKKEQQILNELIRKDIAAGNTKMDLLVEDDIIGDYTLGAMRAYEASGQYKRPELFKDKWLAEYKKQWEEMQNNKSSASNQESSVNPNAPYKNDASFNFFSSDWGKLHSDKKTNTNTSTTPKGKGWPKEQLLKEGGIEINTSELIPKDFDTYQPIKGVSKSKTGVRATGRDNSTAYFDAVEKNQTLNSYESKENTSMSLINDLLSKSKKVIIIPKGQDKYGRDLNDIYLQDENNPNQYHALDSQGVVNREAIFGQYLTGQESKMTDRQKMITKQAQEKGGFKYNMSPSIFRETEEQKSPEQSNNILTDVGLTIQGWSKPFSLKLPTNTTKKETPKTTAKQTPKSNTKTSNISKSFDKKIKYITELQTKENNNKAYKSLNSEMIEKYYNVNESDASEVKNEIFRQPSKNEGYDAKDDYLSKMLDIVNKSKKNYGSPISGYNEAFENNIASVRYNNKTNERIISQVYPKDKVEKNLKVLNSAYNEVNKDYDKYYDEGKKKGIKGKDLVLYAYDKIKYKINRTYNKINLENEPRYKPLFK